MIRRRLIRAAIFLAGFGFIAGSTLFAFAWFTVSIPDPNAYVNSQSTIIQYSNGEEIGRIGSQNRQILPLAKIPMDLRNAVMAAEDRNFYSNKAFSITGISRALLNNLRSGNLTGEGGSTITQQYAKTAFLSPSRTIQRKIRELVISLKLENSLSKDQILENYLNTIYFGRGSYGVQTAAQQYFNRNVDQLTLSQTAVIASILRSPGYYDPALSKENEVRLKNRFQYVINGMLDKKWITPEDAAKVKFPKVIPRTKSGQLSGPKGHIVAAVQKEMGKLGFTEDQLLVGGLVIKTTLDARAQQSAVDAVTKLYPKKAPDNLHIGLIAIRPGTGEIIAMYGGADYLQRQLNDATQSIEVSNYGNEGWGQIDLLEATKHSVNTVFVPLGQMAGLEKVVDVARRAGIPESVAMVPAPSVVLGVASPRVIDVTNAYATFAAQGVYSKPYLIGSVTGPNKGVLYEGQSQTQEVFAKDVMADLTYSLRSVVNGGTGAAALALGRPAAGKTGTSQSNASAWFSAYTPQLAASVALFRDSASESLNGIGGLTSVTGGTFPARIWTAFMKGALKGQPIMSFPEPANVGGTDPVVMTSGGTQTRKPK